MVADEIDMEITNYFQLMEKHDPQELVKYKDRAHRILKDILCVIEG